MSESSEAVVEAPELVVHDRKTGEQVVVKGRIKPNGKGSEIITFVIPLDRIDPKTKKLICIVNVPDEGQDRAPVYIKQTDK